MWAIAIWNGFTLSQVQMCVSSVLWRSEKKKQLKETSNLTMNSAKRFKLMSGYYFFKKPLLYGMDKIALL